MIAKSQPVAIAPKQPPKPIRWIPVLCPDCGKRMCEAKSGSVVKNICRHCKQEYVTNVA